MHPGLAAAERLQCKVFGVLVHACFTTWGWVRILETLLTGEISPQTIIIMNKELINDLMHAVAAGTITVTQNPNISNEQIGETVMIGLRFLGYTTLSDEELQLVVSACTAIAASRDTFKEMTSKPESSEKSEEKDTIDIIFQRNEYAS